MKTALTAQAAVLLVLLVGADRACGQLEVVEAPMEVVQESCNSTTYFSVRAKWASEDESCHQKLSMDTWTFMKAEGSAHDPDAQHVYVACLRQPKMGLVELITPMDWNSTIISAAPGEIVGESEHAASLLCNCAEDFEAICNDEEIIKAKRVGASVDSSVPFRRVHRHLQTTTSEAGVAHKVDELVKGLEDLGCLRTTGEDQTFCVLSDSFDNNGAAVELQMSGDLPSVDVVKDLTAGGSDEGSAMIELAFDIASGATYKFNTAFVGKQTFADDIGVLADAEGCDVIVDDVRYYSSPSFRDGVVSNAIDAATQDHDVLYFSSAGNDGLGHRFVSDWECQTLLFVDDVSAPCTDGVSAHVFDSSSTDELRYFFPFLSTSTSPVHIKWDDDEGSAREITMVIWQYVLGIPSIWEIATSDAGTATASSEEAPGDSQVYYISVHRIGGDSLEAIDMHLVSSGNQFGATGTTATSGAMYGHACATNAFSVAAIPYSRASGDGGAFADPEPSSVEDFSSHGPCIVDAGEGLTTRNHPVTTAADGLQTSTSSAFNPFFGTSAAAPVAAAIATIIRAACFPRVVTYSDMMEMLTDYEYTIDATFDANGATETFGAEAGYGIISAQQMCLWVAQNCPDTCPNTGVGAHGDPHLVGLAGQRFDFTGKSNNWYALLSAWGTDHVNMRVTAPVADLPMVTYITGISVQTEDDDGVGHSIIISVSDPSVLDTSCPEDGQPCLGDGALSVLLDGVPVLSPGEKKLGPGVSFMAANIPGECRPFGFERYWQQKVRETELLAAQSGRRRLLHVPSVDRWIAEDPSATNPTDCLKYVSNAMEDGILFTHQSDHVSFQLVTPDFILRLNHGKLHQLPERNPTDTFDIPDHTTFQMNLGFLGIKRDDTMQGVIGETSVPTIDEHGAKIMSGLKAIRGQEDDYQVDGPLGKTFKQLFTAA